MRYKLFEDENGGNITVLSPDGDLLAAADTHPHWNKIVAGARSDDESIFDLFDLQRTVEKNFRKVTERVSVRNGTIYLDGDPVDNALTKKAIDFLNAGEEDYLPLIKFFEKIQANPNDHSREQAYEWLSRHGFALDDDGNVVAYKSVQDLGDGVFRSGSSGHAIVNGVEVNGYVKQSVGDVVEMPRSEVQHDPSQGCHTGLHVGNFRFATEFGLGTVVLVSIDPRDIVSVPTDSNWEKVRVCRYKIVALSDGTELGQRYHTVASASYDEEGAIDDYDDEDEELCDCCGEPEFDCECGPDDIKYGCSSQFVVSDYTPKH